MKTGGGHYGCVELSELEEITARAAGLGASLLLF